MRENLITALEAAWELDPIRLEGKLWKLLADAEPICYNEKNKESVEEVSNDISRM